MCDQPESRFAFNNILILLGTKCRYEATGSVVQIITPVMTYNSMTLSVIIRFTKVISERFVYFIIYLAPPTQIVLQMVKR